MHHLLRKIVKVIQSRCMPKKKCRSNIPFFSKLIYIYTVISTGNNGRNLTLPTKATAGNLATYRGLPPGEGEKQTKNETEKGVKKQWIVNVMVPYIKF